MFTKCNSCKSVTLVNRVMLIKLVSTQLSLSLSLFCTGNWANDERNGYGTYCYKNGDIYEGQWDSNQRHGRGLYTCSRDNMKVRLGKELSQHREYAMEKWV